MMYNGWDYTILKSEYAVYEKFMEFQGKAWLFRGQSRNFGELLPKIDRLGLKLITRSQKLSLERKSIDSFRGSARFFTDGEEQSLKKDIITLMVLQHYGVPTRLLDWSLSPWVAAYFAVSEDDVHDGEIWSFNEPLYEEEGAKQWAKHPETTSDGSGDRYKFRIELTAFSLKEPPPWIVCYFYPQGFPRQNSQQGAYTLTSRFVNDHSSLIRGLFKDRSNYHVFVIPAKLKRRIQIMLKEEHIIWRGSLFPDSAGSADTVKKIVFKDYPYLFNSEI